MRLCTHNLKRKYPETKVVLLTCWTSKSIGTYLIMMHEYALCRYIMYRDKYNITNKQQRNSNYCSDSEPFLYPWHGITISKLTSIRQVRLPEALVRRVDLDVVVIPPQALVPLQYEVPHAVGLWEAELTVHVWRIRQRWVRCRRCGLKQFANNVQNNRIIIT